MTVYDSEPNKNQNICHEDPDCHVTQKVTRSKSRSFVRTDIGQETCDISDYHLDLFYVNIYGFYSFTIICIFNIQSVLFNKTFKGNYQGQCRDHKFWNWRILENSSKYFHKTSVIRVMTRADFWRTFQFPVHTLLIMVNFRNISSESTLGSFKGVASRRIYWHEYLWF